ncbi:MAG: hypothetical protein A3K65_01360 [Euryarchaeota archaeon RBG_16_68_12]|nr:MAG: hypothetical protein A3K65_01360 [Euryarchaeota archaeon RBG_16_68_12]
MSKVSVYLDDGTVERLRREALRRHGSLRSLSREIEEIVRESFVGDELESALDEWFPGEGAAVGFADVKPLRVAPGPGLVDMIRDEREHRHEGLPRRKRRA